MSGKMSKLETAKKKRASIRQHGWLKGRLWYLHDTKPEGTLQHWLGRFLLDFVWGCLLNDPTAPFRREQEEIDADCRPKDKTAKAVTGKPGRPEETLAQWQARMRNGGRPVESKAIVLADDSSIERYEPRVRSEWPRRIAALAVALTFVGLAGYAVNRWYRPQPSRAEASPLTTSTVEATTTPATRGQTWRLQYRDHTNYRWISEGVAAIRDAKTDTDAGKAAGVWLETIKTDPDLLAPVCKEFLGEDVDKTTLFDKDGWATDVAVEKVTRLSTVLGKARITPAEAPSNGRNSGANGHDVVSSRTLGVSGDRRSIQVELTFKDGSKQTVWILWRCGQIVKKGAMSFPTGPTEEELLPKVASEDPAARGNAPEGGGHNDTDGPGQYRPPSEMVQPPAQPRQNPPAPAPAPKPPVGSKPDPTPAPAPEPAAPTPAKPAEGEAPPPGGGSI